MWNCTNTNLNLKSGLKGNNRVYLLYTNARRSCYLTTTCVHICLTSILHDQWQRWWSNIEVWAWIRPRFISLKGNNLNVLVRLLALPEPNTGRFKPILLILFFNRVNVYFVDDSIRFRSELQEDKSMEPICCTVYTLFDEDGTGQNFDIIPLCTHKWTHYNVPEFWYCPMVTVPWPDFEGEKGYFTSILHRLGQGPSGLHADFISSLHWIYLGWNCFSLYFHPKISADQSDHSVYVLKNYHFYRYMPYDL